MKRNLRRVFSLVFALLLTACASTPPKPSLSQVGIYSAGPGSAFLPYAQGLAAYLDSQGLKATAIESKGSIENLGKVDMEPQRLGTAFLGTAFEAVNGSAAWTRFCTSITARSASEPTAKLATICTAPFGDVADRR